MDVDGLYLYECERLGEIVQGSRVYGRLLLVYPLGSIRGNGALIMTHKSGTSSPLENYAAYWSGVSDLVIAMNENPYLNEAQKNSPIYGNHSYPVDHQTSSSAAAAANTVD